MTRTKLTSRQRYNNRKQAFRVTVTSKVVINPTPRIGNKNILKISVRNSRYKTIKNLLHPRSVEVKYLGRVVRAMNVRRKTWYLNPFGKTRVVY